MSFRVTVLILSVTVCSVVTGCVRSREPVTPEAAGADFTGGRVTRMRVQVSRVGEVPNCSLWPPVVSPDGRWIAYLKVQPGEPVGTDALFTGEGLDAVSLHIKPLAAGGEPRPLCASGAAWPTWSPDSRRLIYVAYSGGRCELRAYDVVAGTRATTTPGAARLAWPAVSPGGESVAVVGADEAHGPLRVGVLAMGGGRIRWPLADPEASYFAPLWTADDKLLTGRMKAGRAQLLEWTAGTDAAQPLWDLNIPATRLGAYQGFLGIAAPLSGDRRRLAYYRHHGDGMELLDLADGRREKLAAGTHAGCWLGARRFVTSVGERIAIHQQNDLQTLPLLRAAWWLPRWASADGEQIILCRPGSRPDTFGLVRVTLSNRAP